MERNKPQFGVTISPKLIKKLDDGKYNKSKLVDSLLTKYFKKLDKKEKNSKK